MHANLQRAEANFIAFYTIESATFAVKVAAQPLRSSEIVLEVIAETLQVPPESEAQA